MRHSKSKTLEYQIAEQFVSIHLCSILLFMISKNMIDFQGHKDKRNGFTLYSWLNQSSQWVTVNFIAN